MGGIRARHVSHRGRLSTRASEPDCDGIANGRTEKFVAGRQLEDNEGAGLNNLRRHCSFFSCDAEVRSWQILLQKSFLTAPTPSLMIPRRTLLKAAGLAAAATIIRPAFADGEFDSLYAKARKEGGRRTDAPDGLVACPLHLR